MSEAKEAYEVLGMWYDEVKADGEVQLSTQVRDHRAVGMVYYI